MFILFLKGFSTWLPSKYGKRGWPILSIQYFFGKYRECELKIAHDRSFHLNWPLIYFRFPQTGDSAIELTNITTASTTNADVSVNWNGWILESYELCFKFTFWNFHEYRQHKTALAVDAQYHLRDVVWLWVSIETVCQVFITNLIHFVFICLFSPVKRSQSLESRQSQFNLQSTVEIGNAALASTHQVSLNWHHMKCSKEKRNFYDYYFLENFSFQKTGPKGVRSTKRKRSSSTTTEKKNQPKKRKISISSMLNGLEKEFKVFQNYFHHHSEPNDEVALDIKIWKTGGILICLYFRDSAEMVMIEENSFGNHAEGVDLQRLINLWKNIERVKSRKEELFPTLQNWNNFKKGNLILICLLK